MLFNLHTSEFTQSDSYYFISEASPPTDVHVDASEDSNIVIVSWSIPSGGDSVIGYQLYYQHVNTVTIINISSHDHTAVFTEGNERVYSVSIQSLSEHLPSDLVGPIIARGKIDNNVLSCLIWSIIVPTSVQNVLIYPVMEKRLNISWEKPKYPNSNTLNYTILIIDLSTNNKVWIKTIDDVKSLEIVSEKLGIHNHCVFVSCYNSI